jgi:hypothetical protein
MLEADLGGREALCPAHLGRSRSGPGAARLATGAGALVQERPERLARGGIEHSAGAFGAARPRVQRGQSMGVEGLDSVAHALGGTPQRPGDGGRALPAGTGQEDLTAAPREGIGGTQARGPLLAFRRREGAYRHGWFHTP